MKLPVVAPAICWPFNRNLRFAPPKSVPRRRASTWHAVPAVVPLPAFRTIPSCAVDPTVPRRTVCVWKAPGLVAGVQLTVKSTPVIVEGTAVRKRVTSSGRPEAGGGMVPPRVVVVAPAIVVLVPPTRVVVVSAAAPGRVVAVAGDEPVVYSIRMVTTASAPVKERLVAVEPLVVLPSGSPLMRKRTLTAPGAVAVAVQVEPVGLPAPGATRAKAIRLVPPCAPKLTLLMAWGLAPESPLHAMSSRDVAVAGTAPNEMAATSMLLVAPVAVPLGTGAAVAFVGDEDVERFAHLYLVPLREQTRVPDVFPDWLFVQLPPSFAVAANAGNVATPARTTAVTAITEIRRFGSRIDTPLREWGARGSTVSVQTVSACFGEPVTHATLRA